MDFRQSTEAFRRFISGVPRATRNTTGKKVGFAFMPWMQTCVPWYTVALALLYRERGFQPHLIFHDIPFIDADSGDLRAIEELVQQLSVYFPVRRLSEAHAKYLEPDEDRSVEQLFDANSRSYLLRGMSFDNSNDGLHRSLAKLKDVATRLSATLSGAHYDHLIVPGGIYGQSGLYFALKPSCRVATFDSGLSSIVVGTNGIAAHCEDVRRWATANDESLLQKRPAMVNAGRKELYLRINGKDRYNFQNFTLKRTKMDGACDVLIPLNLFDDAAGIGRVRNFADPEDWLNALLDHLAPSGLSVVVREHPVAARCVTDRSLFRSVAKKRQDTGGLRFIHAEDPCNTYSLLNSARLVLPVSSSVGVEAACLGVPVVMESRAYYAQAEFVQHAPTQDKYLSLVTSYIKNRNRLSAEQQEEAWVWYYLSQVANSLKTRFTPVTHDFRIWVAKGFRALLRSPDAQLIIDSLMRGEPVCKLVSERDLDKASSLATKWLRRENWSSRIAEALGIAKHGDLVQ